MIVHAVFLICSIMSVLCASLLLRSYFRSKTRFLLWSSLCFSAMAISNVLLFIDLALVPQVDLSLIRAALTFTGLLILVAGLVLDV